MKDYIIEIIITQAIALFTAIFAFFKKLSADIAQEHKKNEIQDLLLQQLKEEVARNYEIVKGIGNRTEQTEKEINKHICEIQTMLNQFITETRVHLARMDAVMTQLVGNSMKDEKK